METSLFTGAIPNPVHNSQTSRFVSVPGQNPDRSNRGDSVVLRLQSVMMADVSWCRGRTGIGYLKEFRFQKVLWLNPPQTPVNINTAHSSCNNFNCCQQYAEEKIQFKLNFSVLKAFKSAGLYRCSLLTISIYIPATVVDQRKRSLLQYLAPEMYRAPGRYPWQVRN